MMLSERRKGEAFAFGQTIVGGFLPIAIILSYSTLGSFTSLAWNTLIAAFVMTLFIFYRGTYRELFDRRLWRYAFLVALFIGVLLYGFYFMALRYTSPGNVATMLLLEVFTTYVFFRVFRGEKVSTPHVVGAFLMVIGGGIILLRDLSGINVGDVLILAAVMFAPIGNFYQQEARKIGSSETILFLRYLLSAPPLFLLAYFFGERWTFGDVGASFLSLLIIGGIILGISKRWWIEAIHRISMTKAIALASSAPFFTLLFAWLVLHQEPTPWQLASLVPLVLGTLLLTDFLKFRSMT